MLFLELGIARKAIRLVGALLCDVIYSLIAWIYQLFMTVSRLNILSSDEIAPIYQRVTMVLTLVMLFYITFEFVKYTIQPDTFTDKEKGVGNILQRSVIVVVLIAFTPQIFSMAYELQNRVIDTQVISKIILGTTNSDYTTYGNEFSANMLNLFYYVDESACANNGDDCNDAREAVQDALNQIRTTGDSDIVTSINLSSSRSIFREKVPAIKFNGFMAIIVGGFIVYILAMYSIDVGTRYAQLIFLQIIAPIAVMGYILPKKDGIFQKWGKQCITTYIDLFLRIAIINFVLLIVKVLGDAFDTGSIFEGLGTVSPSLKMFTYIVLVMGLLVFAQRAPKLLGELFPSAGGAAGIGFGLGAKNRIEPTTKAIKSTYKGISSTADLGSRVAGGVGGLIAGSVVGKGVRGKLRAAFAGAQAGAKKDNKGLPHKRIERALEAARQRVYQEDEVARNVPTGVDREHAVQQAMHHKEKYANIAAEQDRKSKLFDVPATSMDNINKSIDEFKQIKALKQELESAKARGASAAEVKTLDAQYKSAVQTVRGVVARSMDENGNFDRAKFDEIRKGITFTRKELDDNGFVKTDVPARNIDLVIDDGDYNFVGSVARSIDNEFKKIQAASNELSQDKDTRDIFANAQLKFTINVNGTNKEITASAADWINGRVLDRETNTYVDVKNNKEIYAEFVNKFKDAMVDPKNAYENTKEYAEAHAYKDGIGNNSNGGKK